ncbi:yqaJ domain-containing protein [Trichonephila inaurata madagascariensis]|uniref:YqaJ domain-containing protein n=1 Tax=Trichonephila inaurata madagascariensis TaxID=2747483 RepID=A0A8X6Y012_9ARAC|nr:yqaJ domain-containing protein [Trichonephila inaurata madagascariensis]
MDRQTLGRREYSTEVKMYGLFVVKDKSFLCAAADGLVGDDGLIEMKCPYSARFEPNLLGDLKLCDLYLWCKKDSLTLCIEASEEFWKGIIPKPENFYFKCVLPGTLDGRNMPLREPLDVEESSRSKQQKMIDTS